MIILFIFIYEYVCLYLFPPVSKQNLYFAFGKLNQGSESNSFMFSTNWREKKRMYKTSIVTTFLCVRQIAESASDSEV